MHQQTQAFSFKICFSDIENQNQTNEKESTYQGMKGQVKTAINS